MAELLKYASIRGVITGQMTPSQPLKYIDTMCIVPALYSYYRYSGTLLNLPPLMEHSDKNFLDRVITDIVDPGFLKKQRFLNDIK